MILEQALRLANNGLKTLPTAIFKRCLQLSTLDLHNTEITLEVLRQVRETFFACFWVVKANSNADEVYYLCSWKDGMFSMNGDVLSIRSNWTSELRIQVNLMKVQIKIGNADYRNRHVTAKEMLNLSFYL